LGVFLRKAKIVLFIISFFRTSKKDAITITHASSCQQN
jgi:hypothetical protein